MGDEGGHIPRILTNRSQDKATATSEQKQGWLQLDGDVLP